jgi:hypothetical protein
MADINNVLQPNLKSPDTLLTFHNFQNIQIPIFNTSTEDIMLPANSRMVTINILDEITEIFQLNVSFDTMQQMDINTAQTINEGVDS